MIELIANKIFLDDDYEQPQIPPWAIKLVLSRDDIGG